MRIAPTGELRQRQPRERCERHLAFIRRLPCCARIGKHGGPIHAAHLRAGALDWKKRPVGVGEKPSDQWTLPLCEHHHLRGQHAEAELAWWAKQGVDPFSLAHKLWCISGDDEQGAGLATGQLPGLIPF